jgi:hypothetical protein
LSVHLSMSTTCRSTTLPSSRLSADLDALRARIRGQSLTLGELHRALHARGPALLLIPLALPFCVIAVPGLSMPFGLAIGFIGACLALGREPRLPRFLRQRRVPPERLEPLLAGAARMARRLEGPIRPRLAFLHAGAGMTRLAGVSVALAGLALMLPLPIPFSNALPAWAVVLLAMGLMEQDGLFVLLGHITGLAGWLFISLTSALSFKGLDKLLETFYAGAQLS